jgi:formate dehydrogenase major subunit
VTIDGTPVDVEDGTTILDAAARAGTVIPTLCHDPRLAPSGSCRLCMVEVDGDDRLRAACTTPAHDGAAVRTSTPRIEALRETLSGMIEASKPACPVDDSHPAIVVDLTRCVSCWRCVRICEEVQGQFVWRLAGRGDETHVVPDSGGPLGASSCVSCGACVDTCPSGALEDRSVLDLGRPERWTRTVCPYCGVGCELLVGSRGNRVIQVRPALDAPVNRGHACVKGRYGFGFNAAAGRLTQPLLRHGERWRAVAWDEAVAVVADGFARILEQHGPEAVGVLGSARATNEENYLAQKFARAVLRTNNVDSCARVCHAPSATALYTAFGTGAATSSFDDIERARTILVCGANVTENHPVVGARIKQAVLRGARLVVIDPRRTELAAMADVHVPLRPGTNVLLLNAMAAAIVAGDLVDHDFLRARVDGFAEFAESLVANSPEAVAARCGVSSDAIREAARLYAAGPSIAFHGLGVTEHEQGTDGVTALANLALLTGNVGRPGTGVNPLRGQNNVQGAAHMGCEPSRLPGFAPLVEGGARVGAVWGVPVPTAPGLDAMQLLDSAAAGTVHGLWVFGWDLAMTQPDSTATDQSLAHLDLLVVSDLFLDETARRFATVVLPAASAFEKDGTFMNGERRVQRVRAAIAPPGDARTDGDAIVAVAAAMGYDHLFAHDDPEEVWDEIRAVWPAGAGMSYARLDQPGGLQWPCPAEDHVGTTLLHADSFVSGPRAALRPLAHREPSERTDDEFPFTLVTGRGLYQFNAGTMTRRSITDRFRPRDTLELHADDAARLGVDDGDLVTVTSRHGSAALPVEFSERVLPGTVFATFNEPASGVNRLTGPSRDPATNTPAYKRTAVCIHRR